MCGCSGNGAHCVGRQPGTAVIGLKLAIGVKPARRRRLRGRAFRKWPLDSAALFQCGVGDAGVIAEASRGDATPLIEGIARASPTGKEFLAAAEPFGDRRERCRNRFVLPLAGSLRH